MVVPVIAAAAPAVAPAAASAISPEVLAAGIGAGGQLGGGLFGKNKNKGQAIQTEINPNFQGVNSRYLGILDQYLKTHGIDAFIPEDRMPFELRSPEQQAAIRNQLSQDAQEGGPLPPTGFLPPPALYEPTIEVDGKSHGSQGDGGNRPSLGGVQNTDANSFLSAVSNANRNRSSVDPYAQATMAARLGARRLGIAQDAPMFETPRAVFEADQAAKQEELNKVYRYIYGQRQIGG